MRIAKFLFFVMVTALCAITAGCNNQPKQQNQRLSQTKGEKDMEPTICSREAFAVMGISNRMSIAEESGADYKKIWSDFEKYNEPLKKISVDQKYYGLTFATDKQNIVDYVVGMAVPEKTAPIEGLIIRPIPAAEYAIFECPVQNIGPTYQYIINKWLPNSPYTISPAAPSFEEYPSESQGKLPVRINIPVSKKDREIMNRKKEK
jgi:predicted transcriptional regulator YdeE